MGHESSQPGAWRALDDLVEHVQSTRRQIATLEAQQAQLLVQATELVRTRSEQRRVARRRELTDLALREVSAELGAAMRVSDRVVQARMSDAFTLAESFPAAMHALLAGDIDAAHARVIVDAGVVIDDARVRTEYERILLDAARFETPPRLREIARVVAERLDPAALDEIQRRARADRQVRLVDRGDGITRLLADLPTALAHAIHDRLTQMAHTIDDHIEDEACESGSSTAADAAAATSRTLDQKRADVLADLLLTGAPTAHGDGSALGAIRAQVQITVPVLTLADDGDEPALLSGSGPIDPETARTLAAGAPGWDRLMVHPRTGLPLGVDRYRPSEEQRRFLRARDERCRFPGCTQKPWRCDADHTVDHAHGGETSVENLAHLCRRHHTVKHQTAWTVTQRPGGVLLWRGPTGRTYPDRPPATVRFVPAGWARRPERSPGEESPPGGASPF